MDQSQYDFAAGSGHPNHRKHIKDFPGILDVVTVVSNAARFRSRYDLYRPFERYMLDSGVRLTTVELAFGDRPWEVTEPGNPRNLQLRTDSELWYKENLINLGVQRLPMGWQYVAWIDADIILARPDWVQETLHVLQHYPIIQLFSHPIDLGPNYEPSPWFYGRGIKPASWAYCYQNHIPKVNTNLQKSVAENCMSRDDEDLPPYGMPGEYYWHPGFAWACRREAWDHLGGLIDFSIVGAADHIMASCLTNDLHLNDWLSPNYKNWVLQWKDRADKYIRGNLGYMDGTLLHYFHGPKSRRGYQNRWKILKDNHFDPDLDLKRDWQGLWQLTDHNPKLRDDLRKYFRSRDEDLAIIM